MNEEDLKSTFKNVVNILKNDAKLTYDNKSELYYIIYNEKNYYFKNDNNKKSYISMYPSESDLENANELLNIMKKSSYQLAIQSPVTKDNNNLYLDIYNNNIKTQVIKEDDDKPELITNISDDDDNKSEEDKVAQLITNIDEDDPEKYLKFKNALKNHLELAKKLIELDILYEEDENEFVTDRYIVYDYKEYFFRLFSENGKKNLERYKSEIYILKTIIDYLKSGQRLEKADVINIIQTFRNISTVSPLYSNRGTGSYLYYDVLKSVKTQKGGKRKSKGKSNKVAKKPAVSQKKQSVYKEIFGKQMKIYKMPDSRKEYVRYKGELHPISEYKSLMKQKALAKPKPKPKPKK
jgi:hypothetical protein